MEDEGGLGVFFGVCGFCKEADVGKLVEEVESLTESWIGAIGAWGVLECEMGCEQNKVESAGRGRFGLQQWNCSMHLL
jgi:hypothetical protein